MDLHQHLPLHQRLAQRAALSPKRIVFPEAISDSRVRDAVLQLAANQLCIPVILEDESQSLKSQICGDAPTLADRILWIPPQHPFLDEIKQIEEENGTATPLQIGTPIHTGTPLHTAGLLVHHGFADGAIAGSVASTSDVIRAALKTVGTAQPKGLVSSIFLMELQTGQTLTYADCGVIPDPTAEQLADIAIRTAETHRAILQTTPRVALLSFSTLGSANHPSVEKVRTALTQIRRQRPDLAIDGELQFDAAFVPEVARRKAPDSSVAGKADCFIFPNLDAANIAYKITERLAGAKATGPILQGLAKPYLDLSRGCTADDIITAACCVPALL
ncbi:MAG: phosphate acetyltransferase [Bacteroidetes bacterium]|nr:MAG: phosphate acetyltransferase [Bacteroidota bacterium]